MKGAILTSMEKTPHHKQTFIMSLLSFFVSLSSALSWKIADIDFISRIGAQRLTTVYVCTAFVILISSALIIFSCQKITAPIIFQSVQKYATILFGILALLQPFPFISQNIWFLYSIKIVGYSYSILLFNALWTALNSTLESLKSTKIQTTLYSICLYLGMAAAGHILERFSVGATQLGLLIFSLSFLTWGIGEIVFNQTATPERILTTAHRHRGTKVLSLLFHSKKIIILVFISLFFSILVRSTEFFFISDFEMRYLSIDNPERSVRSIGSFVTLIGLGNSITLISWQIWSRMTLGKATLPLATILAFLMIKFGSVSNFSLLSSVLVLIVVESLYAIVVESNLKHLLDHYDDEDKSVARTLIDAIVEPMGLLLSAILFLIPEFPISILGIGVIIIALLVLAYNYKTGQIRNSQNPSLPSIYSTLSPAK